jgi:transcriptional regulator with XRE-family HTH domain
VRCQKCQSENVEVLTGQSYRFCESGLNNVILIGVTILRCKNCRDWTPEIPNLSGALDAISCHLLISSSVLAGAEVRFLRKSVALSAESFAAQLGVTPSHLSRLELGRLPVTVQMSTLVRAKCAGAILANKCNTPLRRRVEAEIAKILSQIPRMLPKEAEPVFAALKLHDLKRKGPLPDLRELSSKPRNLFEPLAEAA